MKHKLTYCLLAILLLASSVLPADDCVVQIRGYHGSYSNPYEQVTMDYISLNPQSTYSDILPISPKQGLTVYTIDAGRTTSDTPASSSLGTFTMTPTKEHPYLALWYAIEMTTGAEGEGQGHPHGSIIVKNSGEEEIGCKISFDGDTASEDFGRIFTTIDKPWKTTGGLKTSYTQWMQVLYDLSLYIGSTITIEVLATTCETVKCTSVVYVAFDTLSKEGIKLATICSSCDSFTLEAPNGILYYEWHKGSPQGPLMGANEPLVMEGNWNIANYYCVATNDCNDLTFVASVLDLFLKFDYDIHCGETADTVYLNNLSYMQERLVPYTKTPCEGVLWDFGDGRTSTDPNLPYIVYTEGGEYTISLKAGNADLSCAKTISKTLTVCPPEPSKDSIPLNPMPLIPVTDSIDSVVCFGTKVEWRKQILTETGIYRDTTLSVIWGVDSIYHILNLHVSDEPVEELLKDTSSCAIIPFMWHGHLIESDTLLFDTIRTVQIGCDSIYSSLRFVVYPSGTWEETQTICDKQLPFLWKDKVCTEAGDYVFDTLTTHGCDSTIILHLIVSDHAEADTAAYVCYQDLPFIWHGKEAVDGDTVILTNTVGCDSIVTLRLTISAPMTTQTIDTTVCDTLMPYTWRGHTFPVVGEFRDTLRNVHGCDSLEFIYTLDTIHCERPLPPPVDSCLDSLVYRKWQDVLFCDNGRHEFVAYQWFRDNISLAGETNQYLYNPGGFGTNEYFVEVTYAGGKKRRTCPLSFDDTPRSADTYARVQTLVRRGERLHIEISDQSAEVDILTILGQQLSHFSIGKTADLDVQLPSGVYVLILKGEQIKRTTKIMVE